MDREHGIEEMRQSDTVRFGGQTEGMAIAAWLIVTIKQHVRYFASERLVCQFDCFRTKPLDIHHRDQRVGQHAPHGGVRFKVFKSSHEDWSFRQKTQWLLVVWHERSTKNPPNSPTSVSHIDY
jgi:hypothetical protein